MNKVLNICMYSFCEAIEIVCLYGKITCMGATMAPRDLFLTCKVTVFAVDKFPIVVMLNLSYVTLQVRL